MRNVASTTLFLVGCLLSPALSANRSPLDEGSLAGGNRYERCLALSKSNASEAEAAAEAWHSQGGGAAALHCSALALVALHRFGEAAGKLDQAAAGAQSAGLRVALFDQAGNAWLLAGNSEKAEASIDSALAMAPDDEDILFDRARARAARKNWTAAEADLSKLLTIDPERADAFVLRASARHAEGKKVDAETDIDRALQIYPYYPEALVERGTMRYEAGNIDGARADWTRAAKDSPNSDAGAAAKAHLAVLTASPPKQPEQRH